MGGDSFFEPLNGAFQDVLKFLGRHKGKGHCSQSEQGDQRPEQGRHLCVQGRAHCPHGRLARNSGSAAQPGFQCERSPGHSHESEPYPLGARISRKFSV